MAKKTKQTDQQNQMETLETDPPTYETSVSESEPQINGGRKDCALCGLREIGLLYREIQRCVFLCIIYKWELELNESV